MAGTRNTSVRSYDLYVESTVVDNTFASTQIDFIDMTDSTPFLSQGIIIANDDLANYIEFSFDGTTVAGKALAGNIITFDFRRARKIYLRSAAGGEAFRVFAW